MKLSRGLYTKLLFALTPVALLRLLWKGSRNRAYLRRWNERFGLYSRNTPPTPGGLWLHAVSVGEFQAAIPYIRQLLRRYPDRELTVTTTTPTGSERVQSTFGDEVCHVYLPYDLPGAVRRFLDHTRPALAIIMETEIWPNLFELCRQRNIPLLIANARLSPHSMEGYRKYSSLVRQSLQIPRFIATQGNIDLERFTLVGAPAESLRLMGNLKFDLSISDTQLEAGMALRRRLGEQRPVWIAASTHEGEETQALEAFATLRQQLPDALLILVPRHPERFNNVARLCQRRGFQLVRRTSDDGTTPADVYLGDTLGELITYYKAADIAFVGGSLVPVGGHNMLEASALGLPVICGPELYNFPEISAVLLEAGAMKKVNDATRLADTLLRWFREPELRRRIGDTGKHIVEENRGALDKLLALTEQALHGA